MRATGTLFGTTVDGGESKPMPAPDRSDATTTYLQISLWRLLTLYVSHV
jgi:hypothetical protein